MDGDQYRTSSNLAKRANIHAKYGRDGWWTFLRSIPDWQPGARILDAGCGAGWFWAAPEPPLPSLEITLLDQSPGMVAEAQVNALKGQRDGMIAGQVGDLAALPFPDAHFDGALVIHMLYHLPDPAQGIAELARVLRPGGWALISANGCENFKQFDAPVIAALGKGGWHDMAGHFGLESGQPLLEAAFYRCTLHRFDEELRVTDPDDVLAYALSFPPGSDADADGQARLRAGIKAAFDAGGGVLPISKRTGAFLCRRKQ